MNPERAHEPCAYVDKLRTPPATFDRWCYVHEHWLNGSPAERCVDKLIREVKGRA